MKFLVLIFITLAIIASVHGQKFKPKPKPQAKPKPPAKPQAKPNPPKEEGADAGSEEGGDAGSEKEMNMKDMDMDKDVPKVYLTISVEKVSFYNKKHKEVNKCDVMGYVAKSYFKIYNCEKVIKTFGYKLYSTVHIGGYICHGEVNPMDHPEMGYYKCVKGGEDTNYEHEVYAKELALYKYADHSDAGNKCDVKFKFSTKTESILDYSMFKNCEKSISSGDDKVYGKFQTKKYYCKAILDPSSDVAEGKLMCMPKYKPCYCLNPYYKMNEKEMKSMMKKKYKLIYFLKQVTHEMYTKSYCKCMEKNWDSEE